MPNDSIERHSIEEIDTLLETFGLSNLENRSSFNVRWMTVVAVVLLAVGTAYNTATLALHEAVSEERLTQLETDTAAMQVIVETASENNAILQRLEKQIQTLQVPNEDSL